MEAVKGIEQKTGLGMITIGMGLITLLFILLAAQIAFRMRDFPSMAFGIIVMGVMCLPFLLMITRCSKC